MLSESQTQNLPFHSILTYLQGDFSNWPPTPPRKKISMYQTGKENSDLELE